MPMVRAARESPAINPPPINDIVLMSVGISPSVGCASGVLIRPRNISNSEATTPPAAHQMVGRNPTMPPKEEAYGLGSKSASTVKSVTRPARVLLEKFLYRELLF